LIKLVSATGIMKWPPVDEAREAAIAMTSKSLMTAAMSLCSYGGTATVDLRDRAQYSHFEAEGSPCFPNQRPLSICHRIVIL
jgi:hypothetical protein